MTLITRMTRLFKADLHGILDKDAKWDRATLKNVKKTDPDRLHAETWTPPA